MRRLAFTASPKPEAQEAKRRLGERYGDAPIESADAVVALGGDGVMLRALHSAFPHRTPIFGMNLGSVGFLMNEFAEEDLVDRVAKALPSRVYPLRMAARGGDGARSSALAFNEISLFRETRQTAKIRIEVDGVERIAELMCDGVLAATPAGSTAYNLSAHGPILPLSARLIALTPISAFRPRRWRGAILPHDARIRLDVLEAEHRPVGVSADMVEVRDVREVVVHEDKGAAMTMLFDGDHTLEERIIAEQFRI